MQQGRPRGGGGGHSTFIWTGGAAGGRKPDPVTNHSSRQKYTLSQYTLLKLSYAYPVLVRTGSLFCKKYTLSQYTLLKLSYAYPVLVRTDSLFCCVSSYIHKNLLRPARAVAGARSRGSRACHKHCGPAHTVAGAEIASLS